MPGFDTVDSIASLVRFNADDLEIQFLDGAILLAPINAAWREVQRRLTLADSPIMRKTVLLTLPAGQTEIGPEPTPTVAGVLYLPDDFVLPYRIKQRPSNMTTNEFSLMDEVRWPREVTQSNLLTGWSWEGNVINFVGATGEIQLQLEYARRFYPFIDNSDTVPIEFAADAIAWMTLFMVAVQRGADAIRDRCSQVAEQQLSQLIQFHVKRDQGRRVHRPEHHRGRF